MEQPIGDSSKVSAITGVHTIVGGVCIIVGGVHISLWSNACGLCFRCDMQVTFNLVATALSFVTVVATDNLQAGCNMQCLWCASIKAGYACNKEMM